MKCPNCGREVRSKTKCAFCGHVFSGVDSEKVYAPKEDVRVEEYENDEVDRYIEDSEVIPKTRRKNGLFNVLWGIVKIALVIFLVFLLIAFGPKYAKDLWDKFGFGQNNAPEVTETVTETTVADGETTTVEETTVAEVSAVKNSTANVSNYPLTEVVLELQDAAQTIERDALVVGVRSNGEETEISDYSLLQEGNKLTIRFNNPTLAVVASEQPEQVVFVKSEALKINEELSVELPKLTVDAEKFAGFNKILTDNLSDQGSVSSAVKVLGEESPYVYADQSVDASYLFSWFVLNRTMDAVQKGDLALDSNVAVLNALKAANEEGEVASVEEGVEYTVEGLIHAVIQQDVTAMNHLIQATGGPNAFNLWLTENQYFSTKVNELLGTDAEGHLTGTTTSVQDVLALMEKLADNQLVSEELDIQLKEWLLQTPFTAKYPEGLEGITRRYEIASKDTDGSSQAYSAILVTEEKVYLLVTNVDNVKNAEEAVATFNNVVRDLVTFFETGESTDREENPEETTEETTVSGAVEGEQSTTPQPSADGFTYGDDTDGDGFPNTVLDANGNYYRAIIWVQGENGLYYFEYAE